MKALAPLTLDLQPRPVHRSVPVMHTNDSGGAGPNRNIATRFSFLAGAGDKTSILHLRWNVNYAKRKTPEKSVFSLKQTHITGTQCRSSSHHWRLLFLPISEKEYLNSQTWKTICTLTSLQEKEE